MLSHLNFKRQKEALFAKENDFFITQENVENEHAGEVQESIPDEEGPDEVEPHFGELKMD